jgi:hypothetical protein
MMTDKDQATTEEEQQALTEQQFRFFVEVFRTGPVVTLETLLRVACEYWGLIQRDFTLYKIAGNGEPESLADEMPN